MHHSYCGEGTIGTDSLLYEYGDFRLANSATALSVGGIRSQFSHPSNVKLSMESANFLRKIKLHLSTVRQPNPDVQYNPQGYLMMATAAGAEQLMKNYNTQIECGAKIMLFTQQHLKDTFPWMNVEGIELATYGLENEGWFDPSSLAAAYKHKNLSFCVNQLKGEVVGFKKEILKDRSDVSLPVTHSNEGRIINVDERIDGVYLKMPEHEKPVYIKCHMMFNCAGAESGQLAQLAGIGTDQSHPILKHKLPVERRKRYVYVFHCPDGPMFDCPMIIDPSGVYVRREGLGGKYICGSSPPEDEEPDTKDLEVNYDYFYEAIWPKLAYRVPVFEKLKVTSAWAGFYDYNAYDQNAVIGQHPYYSNMAFLTGFSGHGIQQAQAASRALAEQIVNGIKDGERAELEPFSFMRIIENRPLLENEII
ncbi:FAD-dependent oxidoreductase domain-containing protein 1-like isoform X2 [Clavelina lepadiformis]|uniref:FAD-dependent oxidoreductase domain-containing protein 1-like isoform X2 n=1 Tax=Clavelina lepadiformis TaxID=159417 RepID=UPI00404110CE